LWLNKLVLYRMEQENQLYNRTSSGADFFRKSAPFFSLVAIFSFFLSVFVFVQPAAAQQTLVCDGGLTGNPTPQCISVPADSALFPPGSRSPLPGQNMDLVNVPLLPAGDQSMTTACTTWDFGICIGWNVPSVLSPMAPIGGDYGAGPFYGVNVAPGQAWHPCSPGGYCVPYSQNTFRSQPANSIGCGNPFVTPCPGYNNVPTIVARRGASPVGLERTSCPDGFMVWIPCGTVNQYSFGVPVDPIVFLPDNRAYMWPVGTLVISGGVQRTLTQQGGEPCIDQTCRNFECVSWDGFGNCTGMGWVFCDCNTQTCGEAVCNAWGQGPSTETILPGDIVMPPMTCPDPPDGTPCWPAYDIGCPAGYVARQYNADGTFNCLDMQAVMDAVGSGDCETSDAGCIEEPDPFDPGTCTGPGCMTGPGSSLLPGLCDSSSLMSGFMGFFIGLITQIDPCDLTFDQLGLGYADEGGEQFAAFIGDWAQDVFLPDMRDMTTQWNVAILDQTLSLLQGQDATNQIRTQGLLQDQQITGIRNISPSENTCAMASVGPDLGRGLQAARAAKTAMVQESIGRSMGEAAQDGLRVHHRGAWGNYCNIFADPDENIGVTLDCTGDDGGANPNNVDLRGADVNIERFLFRDTIDLHSPHERIAAETLLRNLVDYNVAEPMPLVAEDTAQFRQKIRQRNHYTALRQVVVEPVAGIIARRAAVRDSGYSDAVQGIRTAVGIPPEQQHDWPSYNEALLARSKEYFMNLDTLLKINTDLGALRQDQLVNEALIAIMLEDISELEEQINMLLQARSSMYFNLQEDAHMTQELDLRPPAVTPVAP
jgi:hypothetical protein